jgi:RNA polymerase sigma factor (sigma-70 family)
MKSHEGQRDSVPAGARQFATTRWTMVLTAGGRGTTRSRQALEELCRAYWYPLYAYVRRQGRSPEEAQDLTQEFFTRLIAGHLLGVVDRTKGKFRSFLLASLKHFLANEWDKARAQKRGGTHSLIALDAQAAERRYALEPAHELSADRIFERRWALTVLERVLTGLREEHARAGKARQKLFDRLKDFLVGQAEQDSYARAAAELGMSEGAVKAAIHRLRQRYRDSLRKEIAQTVCDAKEVEDEIRDLLSALH